MTSDPLSDLTPEEAIHLRSVAGSLTPYHMESQPDRDLSTDYRGTMLRAILRGRERQSLANGGVPRIMRGNR